MRTSSRLIHSVIAALLLTLFPILGGNIPSAFACKKPPTSPIVLTSWASTGGPSIRVAVGPSGEIATSLSWATAFYNKANRKWEPWSTWKKFAISKNQKQLTYQSKLIPKYSTISFVSYAGNSCGNSGKVQIYAPLKSSVQLALLPPQIASSLPIGLKSISTYDLYPDPLGIPILISSQTPNICAPVASKDFLTLLAPGSCKIRLSENSKLVATPNPDIYFQFDILGKPVLLPETSQDRPDDIQGFQIHLVYVTLRDGPRSDFYDSGDINNWVALAQDWLFEKIGKKFVFDTYQGSLDVSTLNSNYLTSELALGSNAKETVNGEVLQGPLPKLANEFNQANGGGKVGKNLLFIVDGNLGPKYCGWGSKPGALALIYLGKSDCWNGDSSYLGKSRKINAASKTIIHELIHNLGVDHVCIDQTDIMIGDGCPESLVPTGATTIDATHTRYVGGSLSGANILSLKVWSDGSGEKHIPLRNVCYVGEPCIFPTKYWSTNAQVLELQESVGGNWVTVSTFTPYQGPNPSATFLYTYDVQITLTSAGVRTFRYRLQPTAGWTEFLDTPFVITLPY